MANKSCSHYDILGLNKNCSLADIKREYKKLARTWHPDKNPAGSEHIKLINKAYEVLSDPTTRLQYDRSGFHTAERDDVQTPVAELRPYQAGWKVKVRVVSKTPVRTYDDARGDGRLFSVELIDKSGEIRATAFREKCDKFFWLEVGKVYFISRCLVKPANKYYIDKNNYEMIFTEDSRVRLAGEDESIPRVKFNFVRLKMLVCKPVGTLVDVIGVCDSATDVEELKNGKLKREITLVSRFATFLVTLWGHEAEEFDASANPVVAVKGGRVTEYLGRKSVSVVFSSTLHLEPDIEESRELRVWYDELRISSQLFDNIPDEDNQLIRTLKDAEDLPRVGRDDDYVTVAATVLHIRQNCRYKACPAENCQKKVVDTDNGYYCDKCKTAVDSYEWRFLLTVKIADWTGSQWVSVYHDEAVKFLGVKPGFEAEADLSRVFAKVAFWEFLFHLRVKREMYKGVMRRKTSVLSVKRPDVKKHCRRLIQEINLMFYF